MQVTLVGDQEVQRIVEFEQGAEVVVAEQHRQLAWLQALRPSSTDLKCFLLVNDVA